MKIIYNSIYIKIIYPNLMSISKYIYTKEYEYKIILHLLDIYQIKVLLLSYIVQLKILEYSLYL